MDEKFNIFLEIAKELNSMGVAPVLYGSLGLYRTLGQVGNANDIDLLVDDRYVLDEWSRLMKVMRDRGFTMVDEHEHEFVRDGQKVAFAGSEKALAELGMSASDLSLSEIGGARFFELSPQQFLTAYEYSLDDGYRQTKRSDHEKIDLIKRYLQHKRD